MFDSGRASQVHSQLYDYAHGNFVICILCSVLVISVESFRIDEYLRWRFHRIGPIEVLSNRVSLERVREREREREGELRDVIISVLERSAHLIAYVKSAWRVDSRAG